jgi:hypothetical protein
MMRVAALAAVLAVTVGGCKSKQQQTAAQESAAGTIVPGSTATTPSSTATSATPSSTATSAMAGAESTAAALKNKAGNAMDTAAKKTGQAMRNMKSAAGNAAAAAGGAAASAGIGLKLGALSQDQIKQLQTALTNDGCNTGPSDGVVGRQTRAGVACGLKKHNIPSSNLDSLYHVLNLNF